MAAQCASSRAFVQATAPLRSRPSSRQQCTTYCTAQAGAAAAAPSRRQALLLATSLAAAPLVLPGSASAKSKGYVPVKDAQDAYSFVYPFGWQEVSVEGQDVVYKDVIEPLESVSVSLVSTEKTDVGEFGEPREVALTLADKVLTAPSQEVQLLNVGERTVNGRKYVDFEFTAKSRGFTRHALASVTVGNGKFYTLVTGSNERRWRKMADQVRAVVNSFEVDDRF